ncbi:fructosidase [Rodentibacter trehalosifermentans]|uniref:Sucrose-6-phosphate hydrolase n=1 Tax=Rodentibacter trehalosifermentans TaxID=1908263 RepID=A0A1V3INT9_9PAST|nr:glycoside hydrolase family 32 protein [Rodentibacter trehalosifermentans]OOF43791.1 fructosidase [Rodentibacter trehalosifermentans]OOF47686.1 fructosidase [Rodentibacter trehalosifermentans]
MIIFNNGKYKSILAAQQGELDKIRKTVESDKDFYPSYHLAPPTGLLNDPNGLIFDGEKYHLFYQWFPFDAIHGMKHWKHFITTDFQTYQTADNLIPCELFESHGCYSGGALKVGDKLAMFYTGNTRRTIDNQRVPYQNLAIFDLNGKLLSKRPLIENAPKGYTEHVRDPKPYFTKEGKIRFVCGAQRENLTGTAIIFEMDHLDDTPRLIGELSLPDFNNQHVFMWECPDLLTLSGKDIFIWSPQGKDRETHQFQNNYHATYAVGQLNGNVLDAEHIAELDQGFDFYAPQTFSGLENKTSTIMFGWIGLPDLTYPTDQFKWHSALTMPREIHLENNRLYQRPIAKIYENMTALSTRFLQQKTTIEGLERAYLKFDAENQPFNLSFFTNEKGETLKLSYENGLVCLDRSQSEQTELMEKFGEQRYCEIVDLRTVEIFFDRSIIEIFLNDGEKVMTSRFFIKNRENLVISDRALSVEIGYPQPIEYI